MTTLKQNEEMVTWQEKAGFFILPNLFTLAALFFAFFAITEAINHRYENSAMAIFAAMLLDGMDGRVARWTNSQGVFGEQLDSIADMVSFGVAPALIVYMALLQPLGKLGYMVVFIYCACAALRLAMFNALIDSADKKWFTGMPSPSAASLVVGFVWVYEIYLKNYEYAAQIAFVLTLLAGLSMIAPIKFWSFKGESKKGASFNTLFIIVLLLLMMAWKPSLVYFGFFLLYAIFGYLHAFLKWLKLVK